MGKNVKIKTKTRVDRGDSDQQGGHIVHDVGSILEIPEKEAHALVEVEAAEFVDAKAQKEAEKQIEAKRKANAPKLPDHKAKQIR